MIEMSNTRHGDITHRKFDSISYGEVLVLERVGESKKYKVKFLNTGTTDEFYKDNIIKGKIKDIYAKNIYRVACTGNATKKDNKKAYDTWYSMIDRCYNNKHQSYMYYGSKGITVVTRWLCFENFLYDLPYIEGYNEEQFINNELHLDKDIKQSDLTIHDKVYSLNSCCFVKPFDNLSITDKSNVTKDLIGVSPSGDRLEISNARKFAISNNLNPSEITRCAKEGSGKYSTKGWKFYYRDERKDE